MSSPTHLIPEVELQSGDRMSQEEFHRIYERAPKHFKAELIGGIVYVASPLRITHGNEHLHLGMLFAAYELNTPGVQGGDNTTVILGDDSEPQPDLMLRVLPDFGGQSSTDFRDYVVGAPELVAEVALSSRSIDLHGKRDDYLRFGVREYLIVSPPEKRIIHLDMVANREVPTGEDGVLRVQNFPGFWINVPALFDKDYRKLMDTLQGGLDSPGHVDFVKRLSLNRRNG